MFEKEAEESSKKAFCIAHTHEDELIYRNGFQKGAEFGYNLAKEEIDYLNKHWGNGKDKANEWHYAKDGDLPSDRHGHVVINQDWDKVTIRNGRFEHLDGGKADVIAWKEIIFPKLPKEIE